MGSADPVSDFEPQLLAELVDGGRSLILANRDPTRELIQPVEAPRRRGVSRQVLLGGTSIAGASLLVTGAIERVVGSRDDVLGGVV